MSDDLSSASPRSVRHAEAAVFRMRSRLRRRPTLASKKFSIESVVWKKFKSLDGENRSYTTVLLICMNLALLVWFFERGILEKGNKHWLLDDMHAGIAAKRLIRSLILIICAIFNGFLAFFLLAVNLRDIRLMPSTVATRWMFFSGIGMFVANGCASLIIYSAQKSYEWRLDDGSYEKPFPHYMILSVFAFFMLVMDIMYIRTVYLPFIRCRPNGWELVQRNLPLILELGRRERGETSCLENALHYLWRLLHQAAGIFNFFVFYYFEFYEIVIMQCYTIYKSERSCAHMKAVSCAISEIALGPVRLLRWSPIIQLPLYLSRITKLLIKKMSMIFYPVQAFVDAARRAGGHVDAPWYQRVFRGLLQVMDRFIFGFAHIKPEVQRMSNELWESIKEDETYSHSSWLKAASVTATILLVYFGVVMANQFHGYMDDVYHPTRDCMVQNPGVSNFFLRFIGFAPSDDEATKDQQTQSVCAMPLSSFEIDPTIPPPIDPTDPTVIPNATLVENVTSTAANSTLVENVTSIDTQPVTETGQEFFQNATSDASQYQTLITDPSAAQNVTANLPGNLTDLPTSFTSTGENRRLLQDTAEEDLDFLPSAIQTVAPDTNAATLAQFSQNLAARVTENRTEDRLYHCERRRRDSNVCVTLSAVNMAEETLSNTTNSSRDPSDEFFASFTGDMVYLFDVYMRNLEWSVWVGFAVGLLFGIWTLLSVMGQYKRLSLAIRSGLYTDFDVERQYALSRTKSQKMGLLKRVDSVITTHYFAEAIAQYPMSTSIFFSGMLISTAILQLVVFGGLVASVFSFIAAMTDEHVFEFVKPALWTLLAFFITWMVNGPIATFVLGEGLLVSRFHVIHELAFFMFLLVFTSIHLVVGLFLAFFRMLWVLLASLVTINRLDKNLFAIYKERDIGHKSFMALILMQHVFHINYSANVQEKSRWADVLSQLESSRHRRTEDRPTVHRHRSEPIELLEEIGEEGEISEERETEIMEQGQSAFAADRRSRHHQPAVQMQLMGPQRSRTE